MSKEEDDYYAGRLKDFEPALDYLKNNGVGGRNKMTKKKAKSSLYEFDVECPYAGECSDKGLLCCSSCKNNKGKKQSYYEPRPVPCSPGPWCQDDDWTIRIMK